MEKKRSKITVRRQNYRTKFSGNFILYVEGRNTEPSYFELLKRTNCKVCPVTVKGSGISKCVDFVKEAQRKYDKLSETQRKKYTQRWLVFDYDGHNDFEEGVKLGRSYGFNVAFSSMCIEYWFVLHFQNHDGQPIPMNGKSHSKAQIEIINKHIEAYNKKFKASIPLYDDTSKVIEEEFFELMLAIDPVTHNRRIEDACLRAESIHSLKRKSGQEFSESVTNLYQLLIELGVFVKVKEMTKGKSEVERWRLSI